MKLKVWRDTNKNSYCSHLSVSIQKKAHRETVKNKPSVANLDWGDVEQIVFRREGSRTNYLFPAWNRAYCKNSTKTPLWTNLLIWYWLFKQEMSRETFKNKPPHLILSIWAESEQRHTFKNKLPDLIFSIWAENAERHLSEQTSSFEIDYLSRKEIMAS